MYNSKLLFANVWLSDISTLDRMNAVSDEWVTPHRARACVEGKLARPQLKVEIYGSGGALIPCRAQNELKPEKKFEEI